MNYRAAKYWLLLFCLPLLCSAQAIAQETTFSEVNRSDSWGVVNKVIPATPPDIQFDKDKVFISLSIKVDKQGKVIRAEAGEKKNQLIEACLQAARQWVFVPAIKNGKPSDVEGILNFSFYPSGKAQATYTFRVTALSDNEPVPEASIPVSDEEKKWWEEVRTAGREIKKLGDKRKGATLNTSNYEQAVAKERALFTPLQGRLRTLLQEGKSKGYRVPVHNHAPILLSRVAAGYTDAARGNGVQGAIILSLAVDETGMVKDVRIIRRLPSGLTENAILGAQNSVFFPASREGKSSQARITIEYAFTIGQWNFAR